MDSSDENSSNESSDDEANEESHNPVTAVAGVSRDRRGAKKLRLKPINTMIDLIKEARKPNRQHKATCSSMHAHKTETNRTMQTNDADPSQTPTSTEITAEAGILYRQTMFSETVATEQATCTATWHGSSSA